MLSGHCRVDAGAFLWPISTPLSLQCRLCDDGDNYTSVDEFYDLAVAVHLPKPSPVSLPIVLHHAFDTRGTRRDTSGEGRDHGRGGEETTTDTSEIGGSRTWLGTTEQGCRGRRTRRRGRSRGLQKEARRLLQEHHAVDGHHHQAVPADRTRHAVSLRRPLRHNHHGHGTRRREEPAGADASVQRERTDSWKGAHVGTASDLGLGRTHCGPPEAGDGSGSGPRGDTDRVLETARRHEHGREVRSRQVLQGRPNVPIRASSHHAVGRQIRGARLSRERTAAAGSSTHVRQSSSDTIGARTAAVAGHPTREGRNATESCQCVAGRTGDHSSLSEMDDDGAKRGSAEDGAGSKREGAISLSTCGTCLLVEAELVERRDARFGCLADMGDELLTAKGVPPPCCLGTSAPGSSAAPKTAGNVEVVGTSLRAEMILDQQFSAAFQTGLRHSLDDSDHDAMFDLSENET